MKGQKMVLVENRKDPACPVQALTLLRLCCPPSQQYVFCNSATLSQKMDYIFTKVTFKSNPKSRVGINFMAKWCKMLLCLVGCEGWEMITNHSIRGGMCTIINIADVSCKTNVYFILYSNTNICFSIKDHKRYHLIDVGIVTSP